MRITFLLIAICVLPYIAFNQYSYPHYFSKDDNHAEFLSHDFDNDGDLDLIESSIGAVDSFDVNFGNISILEKSISGDFLKPKRFFSKGVNAKFVDKIDFNNDGLMDIVCLQQSGDSLYLLSNIGNCDFLLTSTIHVGVGYVHCLKVFDYDDDGDDDIFSQASSGSVVWLEKTGSNTFLNHQVNTTGAASIRVAAVLDVDNDGDLDLFQQRNLPYQAEFCYNQGNGVYTNGAQITLGGLDGSTSATNLLYLKDIDGDSLVDIVARKQGDNLSWWKNIGSGAFTSQATLIPNFTQYSSVIIEDFDGDLDSDILVKIPVFGMPNNYNLSVLQNNGSGFFFSTANANIPVLNDDFLLYKKHLFDDFTGDNEKDLLICTSKLMGLYSHNSLLNFNSRTIVGEKPTDTESLFSADMDGDGDDDIVSNSEYFNEIVWFENTPNLKFEQEHLVADSVELNYSPFSEKDKVVAYDLDADGLNDVISVDSYLDFGVTKYNLHYYKNLSGSFGSKTIIIDSILEYETFEFVDLDMDGDLDVVVGCVSYFSTYFNTGTGVFLFGQNVSLTQESARYIHFVDYDNDGDDDIFIGDNGQFETSFAENLGGGVFGSQQVISFLFWEESHSFGLEFMDVDLDGDMDIITGGYNYVTTSYDLFWKENQGGGNFVTGGIIYSSLPNQFFYFQLLDLNGDAYKDLFLAYSHSEIGHYNPVTKSFDFTGESSEFIYGVYPSAGHAFGDFDQDGELDVAVPGMTWASNGRIPGYMTNGEVYLDINQNGMKDSLEPSLPNVLLSLDSIGLKTNSYINGKYYMVYPQNTPGTLTLSTDLDNNWTFSEPISGSYTFNPTTTTPIEDSLDFGVYPSTIGPKIIIESESSFPLCNDTIIMWLDVKNDGTTLPSGFSHLTLDDSLVFSSSTPSPDSIVGQNLYWGFDSLFYFSHESIELKVLSPGVASIGDTLLNLFTSEVLDANDSILFIATTDTLQFTLVCAYDPNDKIADPKGKGPNGLIDPNVPHIDYTIRFQNTGTYFASIVRLVDQLDANLDWSTFTPLSSSHNYITNLNSDGELTFLFPDINLPDSNTNLLESMGFVKFRIALLPNLQSGDQIFNSAEIFFDQNPAVITNETVNTVFECPNTPQINMNMSNICAGDSVLVTRDIPWLYDNQWSVNGVLLSVDTSVLFAASFPSDTVYYHGINPLCSQDTTVIFSADQIVSINLMEPDTLNLCDGEVHIIYADSIYSNNWVVNGSSISIADSFVINQPGVYELKSINGACEDSDSVFVVYHVPPFPLINYGVDSLIKCPEATDTLFSNYTDNNAWYINAGLLTTESSLIITQMGQYILKVSSAYCPVIPDTIQVSFSPQELISISVEYDQSQAILTADTSLSTYIWLDCTNAFSPLPNETDSVLVTSQNGSYALSFVNSYGCIDTTNCIVINSLNSTELESGKVQIYPIPTNRFVTVSGLPQNAVFKGVRNSIGQIVHSSWDAESLMIDLNLNSPGIYFVEFVVNGTRQVKRVVLTNE